MTGTSDSKEMGASPGVSYWDKQKPQVFCGWEKIVSPRKRSHTVLTKLSDHLMRPKSGQNGSEMGRTTPWPCLFWCSYSWPGTKIEVYFRTQKTDSRRFLGSLCPSFQCSHNEYPHPFCSFSWCIEEGGWTCLGDSQVWSQHQSCPVAVEWVAREEDRVTVIAWVAYLAGHWHEHRAPSYSVSWTLDNSLRVLPALCSICHLSSCS